MEDHTMRIEIHRYAVMVVITATVIHEASYKFVAVQV
jgi:hypothetical protein